MALHFNLGLYIVKWLSDLIKKKSLIFVGAELTLLYFMIFGFICFHYVDYSKKLSLNELGDLLAGAFAPLAFMWMVITILMQGKELRLQREELGLQRQELANSSGQLERQSNVMESQQALVQGESQLKEIEDKLIDFNEMLVGMRLLDPDYEKKAFNGRVTTPGFFEHVLFQKSLNLFISKLGEFKHFKTQKALRQKNHEEFIKKFQSIIVVGEEVVNLSKEYNRENLIIETGFCTFFEILKSRFFAYKKS